MTLPPLTLKQKPAGTNLLKNGGFEKGWTTVPVNPGAGNQRPVDWEFYFTQNGDWLPWREKLAYDSTLGRSILVPALAGGWGEYVHKQTDNLPLDERLKGRRALILDGSTVYKVFSDHVSHSLRMRQMVIAPPGATLIGYFPILGETNDRATKPDGKLEEDHWRARVTLLGNSQNVLGEDSRTYAQMIARRELDVDRCWNVFMPQAVVPEDGIVIVEAATQQNWPGNTHGVDFFFDDWGLFIAESIPPDEPLPTGTIAVPVMDLEALYDKLSGLSNDVRRILNA